MASRIEGDHIFTGAITLEGATSLPANCVTNSNVLDTTTKIDADKLQHLFKTGTDFGIAGDAAPAADVYKSIFVATTACTIRRVRATLRDCGSSADVKFDVRKATAGAATLATILSATIDFTHADTDNTPKTGTLATTTLAAGDMLVAFLDYTSATGVLGPFLWVEIDENAA